MLDAERQEFTTEIAEIAEKTLNLEISAHSAVNTEIILF